MGYGLTAKRLLIALAVVAAGFVIFFVAFGIGHGSGGGGTGDQLKGTTVKAP